jgi:hypothetical protein
LLQGLLLGCASRGSGNEELALVLRLLLYLHLLLQLTPTWPWGASDEGPLQRVKLQGLVGRGVKQGHVDALQGEL